MNQDVVNPEWLKFVAGELKGHLTVLIKIKDPDTHEILFNEQLALLADDRKLTVLASSNPDSRVRGVTLALADIHNQEARPPSRNARFLRRILRSRFRREIAQYRHVVEYLQAINLPVLQPRHFRPEVPESGMFRRQVEQGYVVVSRAVVACGAVAFTLVSAPADHPISVARNGTGVTVMYVDGYPLKTPDQTPAQALLFEVLGSFGNVIVPATARQSISTF